jgi:polysaccharide biosynthesis/export protein
MFRLSNTSKRVSAFRIWLKFLACLSFAGLGVVGQVHAQSATGAQLQQLQQLQMPAANNTQGSLPAIPLRAGSATVAPIDVSNMKLMPGSMVDLHVFEESDLDGSYRLDKQGNISLPVAGAVQLQGLTLSEAEAAIRARLLSAQVLKVANVGVNLNEYSAQNIIVMGEVTAPGTFAVLGPRKLTDVLALAGGVTVYAGGEIVIQRYGTPADSTEVVHYNRNASEAVTMNVMINPGDTVLVKRAGVVYVLGAVNRPGGYLLQESGELNVDQALAMAAGTALEAKVQDLRVFRKQADGNLVEFHINYRRINNGKEAPLRLKAEDVVYVPPSSIKSALIHGTQVVASAASASIYALY